MVHFRTNQLVLCNYICNKPQHFILLSIHDDDYASLVQVATANNVPGWGHSVLNITSFMNRWILQMGFPVLNVRWAPSNSSIYVSQTRFLLGNNTGKASKYGYKWYVPVWFYKTANTTGMAWITPSNTAGNPGKIYAKSFFTQFLP